MLNAVRAVKILNINTPKEIPKLNWEHKVFPAFQDGLGPIKMTRLGQVVVLSGRNGSGKSRLLKRVAHAANSPVSHESLSNIPDQDRDVDPNCWFQFDDPTKTPHAVEFVPKAIHLNDSGQIGKTDQLKLSAGLEKPGIHNLAESALARIQVLQDRWWDATHSASALPSKIKIDAASTYEHLNCVIRGFLGESLGRTDQGEASLFGCRIAESGLSEGQTILLQFCVAVAAQVGDLSNLIVVLDEPENHLHPDVAIQMVAAIRKGIGSGQLWVATHSIPLLAQFDPATIWWMENGLVSYAGSLPMTVLRGLLGDEDHVLRISDFLNLPFELASIRFAHQCLLPPEVIELTKNDPQAEQITNILRSFGQGAKLRILDFGAGKGRLISALAETIGNGEVLRSLDYVAYDVNEGNRTVCEDAIARIYESAQGRSLTRLEEVFSASRENPFDVVIMCNVLHEIPAENWLETIGSESLIRTVLKDSGFLLIVEDNQIPVGEKPHQKGFIVLDTAEVRMLFCIDEQDIGFHVNSERNGRLKAHQIPKKCLGRVTPNSLREAIKGVATAARGRIIELRTKEGTYQNGRLHGYWLQQFANAELALEDLC